MWSWLVTAVVLLGSLKSPLVVDACSMPAGWRPPTTQEVLDDYSEVLFARVRRTFRDQSGRPWAQNLYTAEVRVYCIMKGQRTSSILNITEVGFIHGHCTSTSLLVDNSYVILATKQRNVYKARRTWQADWHRVYEIAQLCGLQKLYPFGLDDETAAWVCPTPAEPDECGPSDSDGPVEY